MSAPAPRTAGAKAGSAGSPIARWRLSAAGVIVPAVVALAVAAAFLPSLHNGFVEFDDPENIYDNPGFQGLGWTQIKWMFTSFHMAHYMPLTWLSLAVTHALGGMDPFGFHLGNLLLHIATALLFYAVCRRLIGAALDGPGPEVPLGTRLGAGFAALVFAIHPMRVESVVWATERRDVLAGMFFVLTILVYLRSIEAPAASRTRWLALAVGVYLLALFSKVVTVTLPAVLLLIDVYPLGRLPSSPQRWLAPSRRAVLREKIPFVLLSAVFVSIAPFAQVYMKAIEWTGHYTLGARLLVPLFAVAFYLLKTVVPFGLSPLYILPYRFDFSELRFLVSAPFVLGLTALLFTMRRRWPAVFTAWLYFLIVLLPMIGVVQIGIQIAADRFTYFPSLGLAALLGGLLSWFLRRTASRGRRPELIEGALVGCAVIVVLLGARTFSQSFVWRDSERLWKHAIALDPEVPELHNWLGLTFKNSGRSREAIEEFRRALSLRDSYEGCRTNLANTLVIVGEHAPAVEEFRKVESYVAKNPHAQHNWGLSLLLEGRREEAIRHLQAAIDLEAELPYTRSLLARANLELGKVPEALHELALEIYYETPVSDVMDLAVDKSPPERLGETADILARALTIRPDAHSVRLSLARLRVRQGRQADAASLVVDAITKGGRSARAYRDLARLCFGASLHRTAQDLARAGLSLDDRDEELRSVAKLAADADAARRGVIPQQIAALARGTASYEGLIELASAALEAGRPAEARRAAEAAARTQPVAPEAAWILAILDGSARDPRAILVQDAQGAQGH